MNKRRRSYRTPRLTELGNLGRRTRSVTTEGEISDSKTIPLKEKVNS